MFQTTSAILCIVMNVLLLAYLFTFSIFMLQPFTLLRPLTPGQTSNPAPASNPRALL